MEPSSATADAGEGANRPSCDGCRTRKLKCSREKPSCSNCSRLGDPCVYDPRKNKPGLKSGVVDSLGRRIDVLEKKILEQDSIGGISHTTPNTEKPCGTAEEHSVKHIVGALSTLTEQIGKLTSTLVQVSHPATPGRLNSSEEPNTVHRASKRQRLYSPDLASDSSSGALFAILSDEGLDALLDAYFSHIHPWIPIVHKDSFRRNLRSTFLKSDPPLIIHAIIVGALRFVDLSAYTITADQLPAIVEKSRSKVLLNAMSGLSVENLQALIIVVFTDLGDGQHMKAWPIIGSLSRTVEFLELCVEEEDGELPVAFLRPQALCTPKTWVEEEERRRVFWNIFNLDRICSIATGWKIGLTADNVHRRLPICGNRWNTENPAIAPYFGIWDKSAAKLSNSIAFLPTHYPSPGQSTEAGGAESETAASSTGVRLGSSVMDMSNIGAFAYFVESLESLCRIHMYFLQQKVDFSNRQEVSSWLTRFKELDLRLVHWRMFLPPKWKDPNVPPPEAATALDPNMSLAHITHNTSMILLHQKIGYAAPELKHIKLPNFYSAETCQSAAIETSHIIRRYLTYAPPAMPVSPHFAFCAFVSARALLVHSRYYGMSLDDQFLTLIEDLQEMARRWAGPKDNRLTSNTSIANKYAKDLQRLYTCCQEDPDLSVSVIGTLRDEAEGLQESRGAPDTTISGDASGQFEGSGMESSHSTVPKSYPVFISDNSPRMAHQNARVQTAQWVSPSNSTGIAQAPSVDGAAPDDLSNVIQTIMDQRFMDLDRVISLEDFSFEPFPQRLDIQADSGLE